MTLTQTADQLRQQNTIQPHLEALNLLELATKLPQSKILTGDFKLSRRGRRRLKGLIKKRQTTSLAYLKGIKEFYGLNFYVTPAVLIPRPESEDLVALALAEDTNPRQIYDLGSGSGCLGISYLISKPNTAAEFIDISPQALSISRKNCRYYQIKQVKFYALDLRQIPVAYFQPQSLILANLPYLEASKQSFYESQCPELKSEPSLALYTPGDGLDLYHHLFQLCQNQDLTIICESLKSHQSSLIRLAKKFNFDCVSCLGLAAKFKSD